MDGASSTRDRPGQRWRTAECAVVAVASLAAAASARNYAGGWNDGSRLATVESLIDRHTLAIDNSIFVRSPATADAPNPYTPGDELLRAEGTKDKLLIRGHYYSDKSPLPAFWLAAWYQLLQWSTGLVAREHPRLFCYLMTLMSSGVAYVVSIWSIWRLASRKGLPPATCTLLASSLGLATLTLPYARHVNNHILLLAVVSLLMLALDHLGELTSQRHVRLWTLDFGLWTLFAGTLTGLGYTFDLGLGPVLVFCTTVLIMLRTRSIVAIACFVLAAVPWMAAHHAANYSTGGTLGPANSVPEYLAWPGSPFSVRNMTGGWAHGSLGHFLLYGLALLFGKHGFATYNLPLFLALLAVLILLRQRPTEWPELLFATALAGGTWLLYAALSNNYSGPSCSIRWFLPLLAPSYYTLVVLMRERPVLARDLALLSSGGAVLCAWLWWRGPWDGRVPLALWPMNVAALIAWSIIGLRRQT